MSKEYDKYLTEHIGNVDKAYKWLVEHFGSDYGVTYNSHISDHDKSKYSEEEYGPYDRYFYGKKTPKVNKDFNRAWLHHIHNNPHHWQHWVLLEDDPELINNFICIEMPIENVFEMIADWWSFSWKSGNLEEIFDWYIKHKKIMKLNSKTRKLVEEILDRIKEEI